MVNELNLINLNNVDSTEEVDFKTLSRITQDVYIIQDEVKIFGQSDEYPIELLST